MPLANRLRTAFAIGAIIASATPARAIVYGLDVYSGDGTINWPLIAGGGKDFAWAKATEGMYLHDTAFATNQANGTAAGLLMGSYDFARPDLDAPAAEADYFVNFAAASGAFQSGKLVPSLDFERGSSSTVVGAASLSAWAVAWCNEVVAKTGVHPVIYLSQSYAATLDSSITVMPLWIAAYDHDSNITTGPFSTYAFQQYTGTGRIAGDPNGDTDLDLFNGSLTTLVSTYAIRGVAPAAAVPEPAAMLASVVVFGLARRRVDRW